MEHGLHLPRYYADKIVFNLIDGAQLSKLTQMDIEAIHQDIESMHHR